MGSGYASTVQLSVTASPIGQPIRLLETRIVGGTGSDLESLERLKPLYSDVFDEIY